jgi:hypothetical protein
MYRQLPLIAADFIEAGIGMISAKYKSGRHANQ